MMMNLSSRGIEIEKSLVLRIFNRCSAKSIYKPLQQLIDKKIIYIKDEVKERFNPKWQICEPSEIKEEDMNDVFNSLSRAPKQQSTLLALYNLKFRRRKLRNNSCWKKNLQARAHLTPSEGHHWRISIGNKQNRHGVAEAKLKIY